MHLTADSGSARGFTLIEMIVAIVLTGILASMMAVFLRAPLQAYQDTALRATLTDAADSSMRRMARDLHQALPNSIRVTTALGVTYLEYLEVRTAGRYRAQASGAAAACPVGGLGAGFEDTLEVGFSDSCFFSIGSVPNLAQINTGADSLVIFNLGPGNAGADAYAGSNIATITAAAAAPVTAGEDRIDFGAFTFPLDSPGNRFFVVSGPVTYACNPAAGTLTRTNGYVISAAQPTPPAGASAQLANNVSNCIFTYDPNAIAQRTGVVSLWLELSQAGPGGGIPERVNLFQQVHVNNGA